MPKLDPAWTALAAQIAAEVARQLLENPAPLVSPWLNPQDAARYLGLDAGARGLESMRRMERGPKYSNPSHKLIRYAVADLDAYMREHMEHRARPAAAARRGRIARGELV